MQLKGMVTLTDYIDENKKRAATSGYAAARKLFMDGQ